MIVRTKSGNYQANNTKTLLEFLGVKKEAGGIQKVESNVELIASVPFTMSSEERKIKKEEGEKIRDASSIPWTLSTFDLDRMGERIDPLGWDFKQYVKNPVVEWSHRYDIPAIGKIDGLTIDDSGLHGLIIFNDKSYDPFAWSIEQRIKAGVLRAGSVGFRVLEIEIPDKKTAEDGTYLIFRKQELLEFSICNVPANPFALAKSNEELGMRSEERNANIVSSFWGNLFQMRNDK
jgi:HK97 family phage prohead protease